MSTAIERMRVSRARRKKGLRCITVEVRDEEITALVRAGLLEREKSSDVYEIAGALHRFFDRQFAS
jgi:hypothetical protein